MEGGSGMGMFASAAGTTGGQLNSKNEGKQRSKKSWEMRCYMFEMR